MNSAMRKFTKIFGLIFLIAFSLFLLACPKRISGGYEIKNGKVIYNEGMKGLGTTNSFEVKDADAKTFEVINRQYAKDSKNAYLRGKVIPKSDGASFELVETPFSKDKNHVFYSDDIVSNNPKGFKILYKPKRGHVWTDGEKIYKGKSAFLPDVVDVTTFERIGKTRYYRDKNNVYSLRVIEGADPQTFEVISKFNETYARDRQSVFYNGVKVEDCDVDSHKIIDKFHHKDKTHVFFARNILSDDPENFEILSRAYSRDSRNAFWRAKKISDDAKNFVAFPSEKAGAYAKDSGKAFWGWKEIENADASSFVGLNHNYAKDKNNVYFAVNTVNMPRILKDADAATFELVKGKKGIDARDKNNSYNFGVKKKPRK